MTELVGVGDVDGFAQRLNGALIRRGDPNYDEARMLFNAMIDKRPVLIARCADLEDVAAAVNFGREQGLDIAIRGGGHNGPGLGSVDDGLVIDLSSLKSIRVDPDARTVTIGGGCLLGEVDAATHEHGMATPGGIISTTGAGGLMLGGGIGHLTRKCGLSIDNILGAEVALADGTVVTADASENTDLYWAIRGGGGNFGVVTQLTLRLHPISTVVAGPMFWSLDHGADILRWYREFIVNAPEDLGGFFAFMSVPPAPPFPDELHLQKVAAVAWCWTGSEDDAAEALAEPRAQPGLLLDGVQPMPLPALQSAFDGVYPPGDQWYWRAEFVEEIPDEAIERHVEFAEKLPTWKSTMHLYPIDGAAHRVGPSETPWGFRHANWGMVIVGVDSDPDNAETLKNWAVRYWDALHPYAAGGSYLNMVTEEVPALVQKSYGENYERLARVKAKYDPDNLFHVNQNIRPAGEGGQ
ncbi:MAG TPA: FAD-binding oxidoreductase [Gaiellaceae bacterium]